MAKNKESKVNKKIDEIAAKHGTYNKEDFAQNADWLKKERQSGNKQKYIWALRDCINMLIPEKDVRKKKGEKYDLFCYFLANRGSAFYLLDLGTGSIRMIDNPERYIRN